MKRPATNLSGILNINKPPGLTSHDVVARVRRLTGQRKAGHTGTLDPMAEGVLVVCLGQATRLIEFMQDRPKQYRGTIRFGITTNTLDADGEVITRQDASLLTEKQLRQILPKFVGEIEQIPPLFSALKKDGQPLYKLARAGRAVEVAPRRIVIYQLKWVSWTPPDLTLDITCSAGTYIRALARDLGQAAGPGAHLAALVRTANGNWSLDQAISLTRLETEINEKPLIWPEQYLQPLDQAVAHLPQVTLTAAAAIKVGYGQAIELETSNMADLPPATDFIRAYSPAGEFLAILTPAPSGDKLWQPKKVFQPEAKSVSN